MPVPIPDEAYEAAADALGVNRRNAAYRTAVDAAAPFIDRAARIDELKRWIEHFGERNTINEYISNELRERIAELEAPPDAAP